MTWQIVQGDCVDAMRAMPEASVDAVVCDPPYGLEFMGKDWDAFKPSQARIRERVDGRTNPAEGKSVTTTPESYTAGRPFQAWCEVWAREALRVLKPGGHLLAFGGTRTYHRLACAVEDAGFEIRDEVLSIFEASDAGQRFLASLSPEQLKALDRLGGGPLAWVYGSGFPKSLDVSKAIDKAAGAEREVVGRRTDGRYAYEFNGTANRPTGAAAGTEDAERIGGFVSDKANITAPATPDAERWQGWGTALKPAHEPIVLARKPLTSTVAGNVLAHGTGALNVDGCRIEGTAGSGVWGSNQSGARSAVRDGASLYGQITGEGRTERHEAGRWPANVLLDERAAAMLDEQTGEMRARGNSTPTGRGRSEANGWGMAGALGPIDGGDSGGASRFFYVAKASSAERNAGLDEFEAVERDFEWVTGKPTKNVHPTVKPINLMRWLVRLITPPGGTILDPFAGSGSTGCAAVLEGFDFIGVDREPEYAAIARARIAWWSEHPDGMALVERLEAERTRQAVKDSGQLDIFGGLTGSP